MWGMKHAISSKECLEIEEMKMEHLFMAAFNPNIQTLLAVSGAQENGIMLWDINLEWLDRD